MSLHIGVDLGGTNIAVGVVDNQGRLLYKLSTPTLAPRPAKEICADITRLCHQAAKEAKIPFEDIKTIGIGSPGVIKDGVVKVANNLNFKNEPLAEMISQLTDKPVSLCNDGSAAAYGEMISGAGIGKTSLIVVTLGTGIGGGIIINGKIFEGSGGAGSEIGHMIIESGGRQCVCGNKGCFEAYCSATALISDTKKAMGKNQSSLLWSLCRSDISKVDGKTAFDAARLGDPWAQWVIDRYIRRLAVGIHSLITLFQPQVLCIGGGISREGEKLLKPLNALLSKMSLTGSDSYTGVTAALLGNDAGIIGAAMLSID